MRLVVWRSVLAKDRRQALGDTSTPANTVHAVTESESSWLATRLVTLAWSRDSGVESPSPSSGRLRSARERHGAVASRVPVRGRRVGSARFSRAECSAADRRRGAVARCCVRWAG